jgi:hypothetical protein
MRITETKLVAVQEITFKCDYCDFSTTDNRGYRGTTPIARCDVCLKDACRKHRKLFDESPGQDYPDLISCSACAAELTEAWEQAEAEARREDSLADLALAILRRKTDVPSQRSG